MITETIRIQHLQTQHEYQRTPHFHDINEILFFKNDHSRLLLNQKIYELQSGAVVFIPQGTLHQKINFLNEQSIDSYTIHYNSYILQELSTSNTDLNYYLNLCTCIQLNNDWLNKISNIFNRFVSGNGIYEKDNSTYGSDLKNISVFIDFLLEVKTLAQEHSTDNFLLSFQLDPYVAPIIDYINKHITESLTLDSLADYFYTNKYTLCRNFKRKTGITLVTYINTNRIRYACYLLRQGLTVKEVGQKSGFSNTEHFIRTFKTFVNTTPSKYAKTISRGLDISIPINIYQPDQASNLNNEQSDLPPKLN